MLIFIVALCFVVLFALPFLPAIMELIRKQDAEPLFISMDYVRSPRYFGKSFRKMLQEAAAHSPFVEGIQDVTLSKKEKLELTHSIHYPEGVQINHLIYTMGDLKSADRVSLDKEAYVTGNLSVGPNNVIHAIACEGEATIADGVRLHRWLDAEGKIDIGANCKLGISVSTESSLRLGNNCLFRRLFGMPILTRRTEGDMPHNNHVPEPRKASQPDESTFVRIEDSAVPPGTVISGNVVFSKDVRIGPGSRFGGSIKSCGRLELGAYAIVYGSIFADGDIAVGQNARIYGHIFSQNSVSISEHTVVSRPETIKSIVGKEFIRIEPNVTIYGFVTTEGMGRTL